MIENAVRAGKASSKARDLSLKLVKPGAKVLDVANKIEEKILKPQGSRARFPPNSAWALIEDLDSESEMPK